MMQPIPPGDFRIKRLLSRLASSGDEGNDVGDGYGLVKKEGQLFVRIVRGRELMVSEGGGSCLVEVKIGDCKKRTRHGDGKVAIPAWEELVSFSRAQTQQSAGRVQPIEVSVKQAERQLGRVVIDLTQVPICLPSDAPLSPHWRRLRGEDGEWVKGEILLAVWWGLEAEAPDRAVGDGGVYFQLQFWYVRVTVGEAKDVRRAGRGRLAEVFVKAVLGRQTKKTKPTPSWGGNPHWNNQELLFVAAEPLDESLVVSLEDRVAPNKDDVLGTCIIPLAAADRRLRHGDPGKEQWYQMKEERVGSSLEQSVGDAVGGTGTTIHLSVTLEGRYHVLDEATSYLSDTRPSARELHKQRIGVLQVRILGAQGLLPMKTRHGRPRTDAYCVAKYGQKWVRTRTVADSLSPIWNEQSSWEVFDPCTVITFGVFDNSHDHLSRTPQSQARDARIGKVRIRLSTLETGCFYNYAYPLLVLHPSGVKTMGEIQLAVKFTCPTSLHAIIDLYSQPLLPAIHYLHPISVEDVDVLRHHAVQEMAARLSGSAPPLKKEVIEYMLDVGSHMWSLRKSKANFFRIMALLGGLITASHCWNQICGWKNPLTTLLFHFLFLFFIFYPRLILPCIVLAPIFIHLCYYKQAYKHPPHIDVRLSHAEDVHPDELDEEFDTFPTSRSLDVVRMRYDRLRSICGRVQTVVGDFATLGERVMALLSGRDPRATTLFIAVCSVTAGLLLLTPPRIVAVVTVFYAMRHPCLRRRVSLSFWAANFFRRLPSKTDSLL